MRNILDAVAVTLTPANGDMSANVTSAAVKISDLITMAFQAICTGAPVGSLKVQASNDGTNWDDVTGVTRAVAAAGTYILNFTGAGYKFVRLVYVFTSGTGNITSVLLNAKQN